MNEVSLKPVIAELEDLFSKFNARFFADKLEKPVITVSPDHTRGAYGWCTGWKAWKAGEDEGHYESDLESNRRAFQDIQTEAAAITQVLQGKRVDRQKIAHSVREIGKIISNQI